MDIDTIDNELCIALRDNSNENEGDDLGGDEGDDLGFDEGDDLGGDEGVDSITPKVGMEFLTHEKAYKFYNRYALKMGFGIRRTSTNKSRPDNTLVIGRKFVCEKEGKRRSLKEGIVDEDVQHTRESRVGCNAMMRIGLTSSRSWRVSLFVPQHNNHELSTPSKASKHRSHKRVDETFGGVN